MKCVYSVSAVRIMILSGTQWLDPAASYQSRSLLLIRNLLSRPERANCVYRVLPNQIITTHSSNVEDEIPNTNRPQNRIPQNKLIPRQAQQSLARDSRVINEISDDFNLAHKPSRSALYPPRTAGRLYGASRSRAAAGAGRGGGEVGAGKVLLTGWRDPAA